jgi:hypothetical protein
MYDRASKYLPLQQFLERQHVRELPLTFKDVERVLGFELPPSARNHPAWWSNNRGTNVAVKSWRDAGWRTSRVDLGAQRVTFIRDAVLEAGVESSPWPAPHEQVSAAGVADVGTTLVDADAILISRGALRGGAIRLLEDYREENGGTLADAVAAILNGMALERRRQLVERFKAISPRLTDDSTDIIRADRDAR